MPADQGEIVVAGAGIAGLSAALALAAEGFRVCVLERVPVLEEVGAGLQLSPNAARILDRLGVLEELGTLAVRPQAVLIRDAASLRALAAVPLGEAAETRWGAPYLVAHRADLQGALVRAVAKDERIRLVTAAAVTDFEIGEDGTRVSYEEAGTAREISTPLLVGADGVWSTIRRLGGKWGESRFSGHTAFRATLPFAKAGTETVAPDAVTTFVHPRFHLVAYPIRGGALANLVLVAKGGETARLWSNAAEAGEPERTLREAAAPLRELAARAARSGPWVAWPLHIVTPGEAWSNPGGLVLIGDAAHAMLPFAAQGAAMAIEDAATLARLVGRMRDDLGAALTRYEALRRPRIRRTALRGAFNQLAWHARGPLALGRDLVLRMRAPERLAADLDWLYGHDAQAAADAS